MSEEIDGVSQNMRVLTDEDHPILQQNQREQVNERFEGEHAENGEDPLPNKKCLSLIPVGIQSDLLLINQFVFVLLIEIEFFVLQFSKTVIKQLSHPHQLELAVGLLDSQLDILVVVFVHGQSLHFDYVDDVADDLFKEGEEGVVSHDTEYSLSYPYFQLICSHIQCVLNRSG